MPTNSDTPQRSPYPPLTPFASGYLQVSARHRIYYEQCGNPAGQPVIILHGGPGSGINPMMRRYHDPDAYHLILFDQRGCGRSTPNADLVDNTIWALISDIEQLRQHLGIEHWHVFGGSWGSTLALAYAETHPDRVQALVLRGIFTLRRREISWFYQNGANHLFPDAWQDYLAPIPVAEHDDLVAAYYQRLTGDDKTIQRIAAQAWSAWEGSTLTIRPQSDRVENFKRDSFAVPFARIECHYFVHGGFLERDDQLIADAHRVRHIPTAIIQGRYDVVTPMITAYELSQALPQAAFHIIEDAGHAATEPGTSDRLIRVTDTFRDL